MLNISEKIRKLKGHFSPNARKQDKVQDKVKSAEEVSAEFSSLYEQADKELRLEDKHWLPRERAEGYEAKLTPFVKENPIVSDDLLKEGFSDDKAFALIRGMVGAMKEKPELSSIFMPKMTKWAAQQDKTGWFLVAGLDGFVKENPDHASDVLPLFEIASNNPPKDYNQKSTKDAYGSVAWEARENTKDYFLLAEALVVTKPNLADKIDSMVGKFKKKVSLLDAISVDDKVNGGKMSERTPEDWTYYHDRYVMAHTAVKKDNLKKMAAFRQQDIQNN